MTTTYSQDELIAACMAFTGPLEGSCDSMYLDGAGNVTAARGHLIATPLDAIKLFSSDLSVTPDQIAAQFGAVKSAEPGLEASEYAHLTTVRLPQSVIDGLFRGDVMLKIASCRPYVPGFDQLPGPVQVGVHDIHYNVSGGIRTFPHFLAAVAAKDWDEAAVQSFRIERPAPGGISPARNLATKNLILSAKS